MSPAVFGHGHLRLYLLSVLEERDMHGYEIMQAISDRFGGTYVPSAGTIYPRLAKLESEGLVTKVSDGRKTVYSITDAGRFELDARRGELEDIEDGVGDSVRRLADEVRASVGEAMTSLRAELAAAARDARDEAKAAGAAAKVTVTETRSTARAQVQRADVVLAEFRQELRADLRSAATHGEVTRDAVDLLEARLREVRAEVRAALP